MDNPTRVIQDDHKMSKLIKTSAFAAGGVLIGYTAYRYYQARHADDTEREQMLASWLEERLEELVLTLGLASDQVDWFAKELDNVVKLVNRACRKAEKLLPAALDEASIEIESAFIKVKQKAHKFLKFQEDSHLHALHEFYEEFRNRFFGAELLKVAGPASNNEAMTAMEPDYVAVNN